MATKITHKQAVKQAKKLMAMKPKRRGPPQSIMTVAAPEVTKPSRVSSGELGRQEPEATKHKINPEYLKAPHVILWCYPGAPSFDEQLAHDAEVQEQLEKELREQGGGDSLPTEGDELPLPKPSNL